jgi:hypothetical protein
VQIVKITVDDTNGAFDVDLTGFQGIGCDAIITAFGELGEITSHTHKPEYKQVTVTSRVQKVGQ